MDYDNPWRVLFVALGWGASIVAVIFCIFLIFVQPKIHECEARGGTWMNERCLKIEEIRL
jgi:hypothetical protein